MRIWNGVREDSENVIGSAWGVLLSAGNTGGGQKLEYLKLIIQWECINWYDLGNKCLM